LADNVSARVTSLIITTCGVGVEPDAAYLLFFTVEHREIEVDQFKVAGWSCVVSPLQLSVEPFCHVADARVYLHTHLCYLHLQNRHTNPELDMGRVHPRVGSRPDGSGPDFSLLSGLGRVGSICVVLCGSPWIIQNVTLSVIVKLTQFSELLVLLKLFSVQIKQS